MKSLFDRKEAAAVDSPLAEDCHRAARQDLQTTERQKPMFESSSDNSVTRAGALDTNENRRTFDAARKPSSARNFADPVLDRLRGNLE